MEWFALLLIALVVFNVIRKVQEGFRAMGDVQRHPRQPLPPAEQEAALEVEPAPSNWSSGWSDWPGAAPEVQWEAEEEGAWEEVAETAAGVPILAVELPVEVPVQLEAEAVAVPVYSLEALEVDRQAEHQRLHARMEEAVPVPRRRRSPPRLHGREELRRAIVLAEMLGPPRALQPHNIPIEPAR